VIKAILARERYQLPALPTPGEAHARLARRLASRVKPPEAAQRAKKADVDQPAWEAAGLHCSANERRADEASRDVEAWLKCKYMREHLGEEYSGVVSAVTGFGLFVTLDALYVEGLVHITELGGEYFRFDETRQELRGERTGIRYAIGTRVMVQVSRVDLDGRKIDFRLVRDPLEPQLRGRDKDKPARKSSRESAERDESASHRRGSDKSSGAPQGRTSQSPLQALKAAVKKAVGFKKGRKPRR
jgi:ribonuclease R